LQERFQDIIVEIIDFELLKKHRDYRKKIGSFPDGIEYYIKYRNFQKDLKKLPLSPQEFISNEYSSLINYIRHRYDILIVGSDAVWAYQKMDIDNPYWLFGNGLKDVIRMSFAASAYSTDFINVPDDHKSFIGERLSQFQYIGVRDNETFKFIKQIVPDRQIHLNCDPTFLLQKNNNISEANRILKRNLINPNGDFISFMTASLPYIKEIKKYLGNKYTYIHFNHRDKYKDILDKQTRLLFNLSPTEWVSIYCKCVLNFSHYFHGTLLGIHNSVPTISVDKTDFPYPYVGKNEQVMTDLGLNDYLFFQKDLQKGSQKERLFSQIDFAINSHEKESCRIKLSANKEMEKAESFFRELKRFL
jgi:hypothetical protein